MRLARLPRLRRAHPPTPLQAASRAPGEPKLGIPRDAASRAERSRTGEPAILPRSGGAAAPFGRLAALVAPERRRRA
jgi:hypothetical protein